MPQSHAWILRFCRRLRRHCHRPYHHVIVVDAIDVVVVFFIVVLKRHFEATQLVGEEGEEERLGSYGIYTMSTV